MSKLISNGKFSNFKYKIAMCILVTQLDFEKKPIFLHLKEILVKNSIFII